MGTRNATRVGRIGRQRVWVASFRERPQQNHRHNGTTQPSVHGAEISARGASATADRSPIAKSETNPASADKTASTRRFWSACGQRTEATIKTTVKSASTMLTM